MRLVQDLLTRTSRLASTGSVPLAADNKGEAPSLTEVPTVSCLSHGLPYPQCQSRPHALFF